MITLQEAIENPALAEAYADQVYVPADLALLVLMRAQDEESNIL